jgi:hypothetical protein
VHLAAGIRKGSSDRLREAFARSGVSASTGEGSTPNPMACALQAGSAAMTDEHGAAPSPE